MWFTSVYLKTLRDFRVAIVGWGAGIGLLIYAVLVAFPSLVTTAAARASLVSLARSFAWIAEPIQVDTPGGYVTWKYGFTILVMALWPLLVGSRMLRGEEEEERGSLDALLALPVGRGRVALEKMAAMWTALLAMAILIGMLAFAAGTMGFLHKRTNLLQRLMLLGAALAPMIQRWASAPDPWYRLVVATMRAVVRATQWLRRVTWRLNEAVQDRAIDWGRRAH